jgi:hypothetical protein
MATNPILDIPIRKRESTNVPLPFEAMYTVLAEKQKRYDTIEALERQQKALITNFTSPIQGHNTYLEQKKQGFLQQAMQLHNSMPDKASAEYQRQLNNLIDSWNMDPNIASIRESSTNWTQRIDAVKQLMLNDKYSPIMDPDANFTGVNPDGSIAKYNFYGIKPKPDYGKSIQMALQATPDEKRTVSYYKDNMQHTAVYAGKMPEKLENNMNTYLSPDDIKQIMFDNKLKTPAQYEKWKKAQAISLGNYNVSTEDKPETSLSQLRLAQENAAWDKQMDMRNYELNKAKTLIDAMGKGAGVDGTGQTLKPGTLTLPNVSYNEDVKDQITPQGEINSTGGFLLWGDSKEKTLESNPAIAKIKINADKVNKILGKGKELRNYKKDLIRLREGAMMNIDKYNFTNSKDADEAMNLITAQANTQDAKVWKINPETGMPEKVEGKDWQADWKKMQDNGSDTFAKMAGPMNSLNPYGAEAYDINFNGQRYIVAVKPSSDLQGAIKQQNHEIAKAFNAGYAEFPNGYIRYKIGSNGQLIHDVIKGKVNVYFPNPDNPYDRIIESQDPKNPFIFRESGQDAGF